VAESIGMNSLALSCEGSATRHPIEGIAGCLGDVPAGYCLRAGCDVVTCPGASGHPLALDLARAER
jgi:hypothetical protein